MTTTIIEDINENAVAATTMVMGPLTATIMSSHQHRSPRDARRRSYRLDDSFVIELMFLATSIDFKIDVYVDAAGEPELSSRTFADALGVTDVNLAELMAVIVDTHVQACVARTLAIQESRRRRSAQASADTTTTRDQR